jgi:hypothetical protein
LHSPQIKLTPDFAQARSLQAGQLCRVLLAFFAALAASLAEQVFSPWTPTLLLLMLTWWSVAISRYR